MLRKLQEFSTPTVGNIVATHVRGPLCLKIYEPWRGNWYTDQSVHCMYPELGRTAGYAVTAVWGMPDPEFPGYEVVDLLNVIDKSKKPVVIVAYQDFPPDKLPRVGLVGGVTAAAYKALGAVAFVTNGPSRDVDEIRPLKFQCIHSGLTPAHGHMVLKAINVPVSVAGMDVAPGDVIHMDEHGACKLPADRLADICKNIEILSQAEGGIIKELMTAKTIEDVKVTWKKNIYA